MLRKPSTIIFCLFAGIGIFRFPGLGAVLGAEPNPTQPVCLEPIGVRQLIAEHPELTGATVRIGIIELCQSATPRTKKRIGAHENQLSFLPNLKHQALQESNLSALHYFYNPYRPAGNSSHASLIAGILTGHDPNAGFAEIGDFAYRGIVPEAELEIFETNWFLYKRVLSPQAEAMDNDVLTLSWGTDATDRITMLWQRGIDALAVRDGCVIVAGCGNGEGKFSAISKPSWGGNIISVGAARSLGVFPDNLKYLGPPTPDFSSCGPTDDGRAKPDIIAPGLALGPDAYSQDGYRYAEHSIGYSSFAAPQVAGVAALLIDAARRHQVANGNDPRLIKALLLNGATKLSGWHKGSSDPADDSYVPLDYRQGAGLVNARNSYQQLMEGRYIPELQEILDTLDEFEEMIDPNNVEDRMQLAEFKERLSRNTGWDVAEIAGDTTDPNSTRIYTLPKLIPEGGEFKATLTWYKPYSMYGSFKELPLPLLTLELWSVDPNGMLQERLDYSDSELDNLQHIYYRSTRPMRMTLVVKSAADTPTKEKLISYALAYSDTDEPFSGDQLGADFNADGTVDVDDLMQFLEIWRSHRNNGDLADRALLLPYLPEDLNLDGLVNTQDFEQISGQWHQKSVWHKASKKVKGKR